MMGFVPTNCEPTAVLGLHCSGACTNRGLPHKEHFDGESHLIKW